MRTESFHADDLAKALRRCKIATMPELKRALGTEVDVTVFRKLQQLAYRTSYSHRGSYYTLDENAHFDHNGLWSFQSVWFSRQGTLLDTARAIVENSSAGYFAEELDHVLHVGTKEPLLRLVQHERVARQPVQGLYLYCSLNPVLRERQLLARHALQAEPHLATSLASAEVVSDELKAAIVLFSSMLNEKQRRLYAGLESLKVGYGGDRRMAEFIGLDPHTVAQGRRELLEQDLAVDRIRKAGGGRKRAEKKTPEVISRIEELMRHDTAGSHYRGEVEPAHDAQDRRTTRRFGHRREQEHGGPLAQKHGLQAPCEPPADRLHQKPPMAINSSFTWGSNENDLPAKACPASVSIPRRRNQLATSKIPAPSGIAHPSWSRIVIFARMPTAWRSPTAFTTHRPIGALCSWGPATTRRPWPSTPSLNGG
jgi:hypothetical protein